MPGRAHYRYVTESWVLLFEETGLTVARVASETDVQVPTANTTSALST